MQTCPPQPRPVTLELGHRSIRRTNNFIAKAVLDRINLRPHDENRT